MKRDWNGFRTFCERKVEEKKLKNWWSKPCFDGKTPDEMWEINPSRVVTYLLEMR